MSADLGEGFLIGLLTGFVLCGAALLHVLFEVLTTPGAAKVTGPVVSARETPSSGCETAPFRGPHETHGRAYFMEES